MIREWHDKEPMAIKPDLIFSPIYDHESDEYWSKQVDAKVLERSKPEDEITLYGGRDSFIPTYSGIFKTKEIQDLGILSMSGTEAREAVQRPDTKEGRAGAIWASYNQWPKMYQVVDALILNANGQVLMCRKEGCEQWSLVGGFVDPEDETLEDAVKREVKEETGLEVSPEYQFSLRIDDRRYTKEVDKVMSHVFLCTLAGNCFDPVPADDIVEAKWFDRMELPPVIENHKQMLEKMGMGFKER